MKGRGERIEKSGKETLFTFAVFSAICYFILHKLPLAVDDLGFQQMLFPSFEEALQYVLRYGNGRLLGNGGIIFLTHHLFISDLVRAMLLSGVAVLLPAVLQLKNRMIPLLSLLLLLTVSPGIFGQAYSWLSGFQNYVPPVFLFLSGLRCVESTGPGISKFAKISFSALSFLCGTCMQLYIEHSTCINLCLSILILVAVWNRKEWRTYRPAACLFLAGAGLGSLIMGAVMFYSNPQVLGGTVGHTSYISSGFASLAYGFARNTTLLLGMLSENAIILFLLPVLLTLRIMKYKTSFYNWERFFYPLCMLLAAAVFMFQFFSGFRPWYGKLAVFESAWIFVGWIVYITAFVILENKLLTITERNDKLLLAGVLVGVAAFGILPLLMIWPIGYRCLLHSVVALIGAVLLLADEMLNELGPKKERIVHVAVLSVFTAVVICLGMIFSDARRMVSIRDAYIEEQARLGVESAATFMIPSPYIYDSWNEETEHYRIIDGHRIRLSILPADVWFHMYYYHYT